MSVGRWLFKVFGPYSFSEKRAFIIANTLFKAIHSRKPELWSAIFRINILPIIDYSIELYWPQSSKDADNVESILRSFSKRVFHKNRSLTYMSRLSKLKMTHILRKSTLTAYKILAGFMPLNFSLFPNLSARSGRIILPRAQTNLLKKFLFIFI